MFLVRNESIEKQYKGRRKRGPAQGFSFGKISPTSIMRGSKILLYSEKFSRSSAL
jgi:hypothetical protein